MNIANFKNELYNTQNKLQTFLKMFLFFIGLGLIFNFMGYVPEYFRLFFIYIFFIPVVLLLKKKKNKYQFIFFLFIFIFVNSVLTFNPITTTVFLIMLNCFIYKKTHLFNKVLFHSIFLFTVIYIILFQTYQGFYLLGFITSSLSHLYSNVIGYEINAGFTFLNIGALILYITIALHLLTDKSLIRRILIFILLLLFINSLCLHAILFKLEFNANLIWELKWQEPFLWKNLGNYSQRLLFLFFPALLYMVNTIIFLCFFFHNIENKIPDEVDNE